MTPITYFSEHKIKINKICLNISSSCSLFITKQKKLYVNGSNHYNQLCLAGKTSHDECQFEPTLISELANVIDALSTWRYSLVLTSINITLINSYWVKSLNVPNAIFQLIEKFYGNTNSVYMSSQIPYVYGGRCYGFNAIMTKNNWEKIKAFNNKKVVNIAAGTYHSLFLESNGNVWSCGDNEYGQLGIGDNRNVYNPVLIKYFIQQKIKVLNIACGRNHNLVMNETSVYAWGLNEYGQCGNGTTTNIHEPKLIYVSNECSVQQIKAGAFHSYICINNEHYLFGCNEYNECIQYDENGYNMDDKVIFPYLINDAINKLCESKRIKDVYLGNQTTMLILIDK
eukprot:52154_1